VLALEQVRDAAGELDHFHAAGQFAARIREYLAMLARDRRRDRFGVAGEQFLELEQDAGAVERRGRRPSGKARWATSTTATTSSREASATCAPTLPLAGS
jgi:hypothetical protein